MKQENLGFFSLIFVVAVIGAMLFFYGLGKSIWWLVKAVFKIIAAISIGVFGFVFLILFFVWLGGAILIERIQIKYFGKKIEPLNLAERN